METFRRIGVSLAIFLALAGSVFAQVNLNVTSVLGSWTTEVGWQVVNTTNGITYNCEPYGGSIQNGVIFNAAYGNYEVRAFDSFGDGWNGNRMSVTNVSTGQILVNSVTLASGGSQANFACPGPTAVNSAAQVIATFVLRDPCSPPTITSIPPTTNTVCSGQSLTFSVTAALGVGPGTYEWFKDGVSQGVTTTNFFTIPNVQAVHAGIYNCTVRDNCNPSVAFTASASWRLTVVSTPSITQDLPATRSVCESTNDTLRVRATGAGRMFQWFKDGAPIPGATDSNYVVNNAQLSSAGQYFCQVSGTCSPAATSSVCAVTVAARPRITLEPTNLDVCPGSSGGSISVAATGNNLAYQWYKDGSAVAGANSATLSFTNYNYSMNGQYYCMVTSNIPNPNNCNITAQSRTVRVSGFRTPVVKTQPSKTVDACVGTSASILAQFSGTGLTYQWFKDGKLIANSNSNELNIANVTAVDAGKYVVVATGTCGLSTSSDTVSITVIGRPTISKQPVDAKLTVGDRLDLSVEATNIRAVQWYKNDAAIPGATTASFSIASVVKSNAGYYSARITNSCGGVVSNYARVEVSDPVVLRPAIELGQVSADFGEIPVGYDKSITLTGLIKNVGNAPLSVTALDVSPSEFSVSNAPATPFEVAPGNTQTVTIKAAPTTKGPLFGTLKISSNAPLTPQATVALSASYVLRYNHPASQAFGLLETGKSVDKCVTVTNNSTQEIIIDQATVTGMNAAEFTVTTSMPVTIAAGASAEICIKFAPGTAGKKSAQLSLRSANGGNSTIDLSGSGEVPGGVIDAIEAGITAWPNPVRDVVRINFGKPMPGMVIELVSTNGQVVSTFNHDGAEAGSSISLNLGTTVPSGSYSLLIRAGGDILSMPVTVVR